MKQLASLLHNIFLEIKKLVNKKLKDDSFLKIIDFCSFCVPNENEIHFFVINHKRNILLVDVFYYHKYLNNYLFKFINRYFLLIGINSVKYNEATTIGEFVRHRLIKF